MNDNHSSGAVLDWPVDESEACAKCGSTKPWGASSWCPDCGYYPLAEDLNIDANLESLEAEDEEVEKPQEIFANWMKVLFAGCFVVLAANLGTRWYFFYNEGDLGLVAIFELVIGISCISFAQLWAAAIAMKENDSISLPDVVLNPVDIWMNTFRQLPKGHLRVQLAGWGICATLASFVILGGFNINRFFSPPRKQKAPNLIATVAQTAAASNSDAGPSMEGGLEESMQSFVEDAGVDDLATQPSTGPAPGDYFSVYGYMTDGSGSVTRLLFSNRINGQQQHVATLDARSLSNEARQLLSVRLPGFGTNGTEVSTRYRANWVRPVVRLPLHYDSISPAGVLSNPRVSRMSAIVNALNPQRARQGQADGNQNDFAPAEMRDLENLKGDLEKDLGRLNGAFN